MEVDILIRNESTINSSDADLDRKCYKKGFHVDVMDRAKHIFTEGPPNFSIIRITDAESIEQVTQHIKKWERKTLYTILNHEADIDKFNVKIYTDPTTIDTSSNAQVTANEMEEFLLSWGAEEIVDDEYGGVLFEITAMDAITHSGYFSYGEEADEDLVYTELSYNPTTGVHIVELEYYYAQQIIDTKEKAEAPLLDKNCIIVSHDTDTAKIVFEAQRTVMIGYLEKLVREKFHIMWKRSEFKFPESVVDEAIENSGLLEMTYLEMVNCLEDCKAE